MAPLAAMRWPVLQSSANPSGGADARRLDDVDARIRAAVDVELDAGALPCTPSTVVDLVSYEDDGSYEVQGLPEGAKLRMVDGLPLAEGNDGDAALIVEVSVGGGTETA